MPVGPIPGPVDSKEENSQRTGRKDPEEKKSGVTNNQPASRAREPDKQPAKGPQEPLPESSLASLPSPAQVPVGGSPDAAEPSSAKVYPKEETHNAQMWDTATSAVQAFATVLASPVKQSTSCKQVEAKLLCPPEVCFPLSDLLGPGLLVYDVDNHFGGQSELETAIQAILREHCAFADPLQNSFGLTITVSKCPGRCIQGCAPLAAAQANGRQPLTTH